MILFYIVYLLFCVLIVLEYLLLKKVQCKAVPLQAWSGPEGSRKLKTILWYWDKLTAVLTPDRVDNAFCLFC